MGLLEIAVQAMRLDVLVVAVLVLIGLAPWTAYLVRARRRGRD